MADSGWYPDPGNDGFERYWDGNAWSTSTRPRVVEPTYQPPWPQQPAGPDGPGPGGQFQPNPAPNPFPPNPYGQPGYGAAGGPYAPYQPPGVNPYGGYVPYGMATPTMMGAPYGKRLLAYLVDTALAIAPLLVAYGLLIVAAIGAGSTDSASADGIGALAVIIVLVTLGWAIGFGIWNLLIRQGRTGQTIGKQKMGIRLIKTADGQPIGGGMALARYLVPNVLGNLTCGIFSILDLLWPLWDEHKQRLVDKWLKFQVIEG